jgi:hypothetical protein
VNVLTNAAQVRIVVLGDERYPQRPVVAAQREGRELGECGMAPRARAFSCWIR